MEVIVRIIDLDLKYAEALARSLAEKLPEFKFIALNIPTFISNESEVYYLDIFNPEQFPRYKPTHSYLLVYSENPQKVKQAAVKPELYLSKFSPLNMFTNKITSLVNADLPNFKTSGCITTFITYNYTHELEQFILKQINSAANSTRAFVLNMGANFLFTASEAANPYNSSEYLLQISLNKFQSSNFADFLENSPLSPGIKRLRLSQHPDDWLLASDDLIRFSIKNYVDFLEQLYPDNWDLYIISANLSQRSNQIICSLSHMLYLDLREINIHTQEDFSAQLIANLSKGSSYKYINSIN